MQSAKSPRLLADGAWGTEFMKRGAARGDAPERLNLTAPETVLAVAADYVAAGADIILTNSFGGTRVSLDRHGLGDETVRINTLAASISRRAADGAADATSSEARGRSVRVAGSMGPTGKLLITGDIDRDTISRAFREQAAALIDGGADLLVIESMTDMEEMLAAVEAARETAGGADILVISSMVYEPVLTGGYRTIMGNTPRECVERALTAGASIVGANCGTGIERYLGLAAEIVSFALAPVWIKPNRGIPEVVAGATVYHQEPSEFASYTRQLIEAGVSIVGGCCGTTPDFIAAMRPVLDEWNTTIGTGVSR